MIITLIVLINSISMPSFFWYPDPLERTNIDEILHKSQKGFNFKVVSFSSVGFELWYTMVIISSLKWASLCVHHVYVSQCTYKRRGEVLSSVFQKPFLFWRGRGWLSFGSPCVPSFIVNGVYQKK